MPRLKSVLIKILSALMVISLLACQDAKTPKKVSDQNLSDQEKIDQKYKADQEKQKGEARHRKMMIENRSVRIASMGDSSLNLRLLLGINRTAKLILFSMPINSSDTEQIITQDKSEEIRSLFPNYTLEVSAYNFKVGQVGMLALEYRLMKYTTAAELSASQFVLLILDKSLGDRAVVKSHFEFPSKSDLKEWAQKASVTAMGSL